LHKSLIPSGGDERHSKRKNEDIDLNGAKNEVTRIANGSDEKELISWCENG
jgi:hypothetical protein